MGILEVLTIVFIVLKLCGVITWSWWLVWLPELIAIGLYMIGIAIAVAIGKKYGLTFSEILDVIATTRGKE